MSVQLSELANGMRVVTHAMPHLETVSLGVWVGAGARDEASHEHGISHLLEHMAFKGTARRSAREIVEEIEAAGGDLNAATSLETTAYYARVLKGDVGLALDLLADILLNPRYDERELVREKEVILQEIAASDDSPDDIVHDLAQEAAFSGQALGRPILGSTQSVRGFHTVNLQDYLTAHYGAGKMVLAAAGALDHDTLVAMAQDLFADHGAGVTQQSPAARYVGGTLCSAKRFEQSHVVVAFEAPSYREDAFYSAQVLSSILGGGMSSRLFQKVREERGLCYSIYSYCWGLADTGLFGMHAATGEEQLPELLDVIRFELEHMAEQAPDEAELGRAKAQLKAGLLMSLESSGARAEQIARQVLAFGRVLDIGELSDRVEGVSAESVRSLAEELFGTSRASLAVAGSPRWAGRIDVLTEKFQRAAVEAAE